LENVSIPQSVWCTTANSRVPSSRDEMISDRIASSDARPPALRMTCASPSDNPRNFAGCSLASMHATTATARAGGIPSPP
jgi:hypothetical protein